MSGYSIIDPTAQRADNASLQLRNSQGFKPPAYEILQFHAIVLAQHHQIQVVPAYSGQKRSFLEHVEITSIDAATNPVQNLDGFLGFLEGFYP